MAEDPVLEAVRTIINRFDPEGLLQMGAPEDEYNSEVKDLTRLVKGDAVITAASVAAVFDRWFGSTSTWTAQRPAEVVEAAAKLETLRHTLDGRPRYRTGDPGPRVPDDEDSTQSQKRPGFT